MYAYSCTIVALDSSYLIPQNEDTTRHINFVKFALASIRVLVWSILEMTSVTSCEEPKENTSSTIFVWRDLRLSGVGLYRGYFSFFCIVDMCCNWIRDSVKDMLCVKVLWLGLGSPPTRPSAHESWGWTQSQVGGWESVELTQLFYYPCKITLILYSGTKNDCLARVVKQIFVMNTRSGIRFFFSIPWFIDDVIIHIYA